MPPNHRDEILIRPFQPGDEAAFRSLNELWINQYFAMEAKDRATLDHPRKYILDPGGEILFAIDAQSGQPIGCCALAPIQGREAEFEVSKLTVDPSRKGSGIGRQIMLATIDAARTRLKAKRLYLETNHVLTPAIRLYESLGFRHLRPEEITPSPYARADVYMELLLG